MLFLSSLFSKEILSFGKLTSENPFRKITDNSACTVESESWTSSYFTWNGITIQSITFSSVEIQKKTSDRENLIVKGATYC